MRLLFEYLIKWILKRPFSTVISILMVSLTCAIVLFNAKLDFSFMALMPTNDPTLVNFQNVSEELAINNQLMLLLEDDSEEKLDAVEDEIINTMKGHQDVVYVVSTPKRAWFEENIAWIAPDAELDFLLNFGANIGNGEKLSAYQDRLLELDKEQAGFRVLWFGLNKDPLDVNINDITERRLGPKPKRHCAFRREVSRPSINNFYDIRIKLWLD